MVKPCPCKGRVCTCNVDGTAGLTWSGNGTDRQPYRPHWSLPALRADDNAQADVTVTGSGTFGDPWVVSIVTLGGSVVQTIYENDDTWVKPDSGTIAQVVVIGGGGGGGSAAPGAAAGGSGGAGGAMSVGWFPLADLPDEVDVVVGPGGKGGRPIVGDTTGVNGGRSTFGPYLYAGGGRAGKSQASPSQTQYTTVGGTPPEGGPGGAGAVRNGGGVIAGEDHLTFVSPTGGGSGEGTTVDNGAAGNVPFRYWGADGGEGGDLSIVGPTSWPGEPGGLYGGGGGGGAAETDDAWSGGKGGDGVVVVTVW